MKGIPIFLHIPITVSKVLFQMCCPPVDASNESAIFLTSTVIATTALIKLVHRSTYTLYVFILHTWYMKLILADLRKKEQSESLKISTSEITVSVLYKFVSCI